MSSDIFVSTFGDFAASFVSIEESTTSFGISDLQKLQDVWATRPIYEEALSILKATVEICERVQKRFLSNAKDKVGIKRNLSYRFGGLVPSFSLQKVLYNVFYAGGIIWLEINPRDEQYMIGLSRNPLTCLGQIVSIVQRLRKMGLGGSECALAFALVVDQLMTVCVRNIYALYGISGSLVATRERDSQDRFVLFGEKILAAIRGGSIDSTPSKDLQVVMDVWKERFSFRHGQLQSHELLDLIIKSGRQWRKEVFFEELGGQLKGQRARRNLISQFNRQLSLHLLRPSVSTVAILDTYMLIIRRMHELDKSGIVLFAASELIRNHLRDREDLVKVILLSLLADIKDDYDIPFQSNDTLSYSITRLMEQHPHSGQQYEEYYEGIDLDDLSWQPEPIEAGVGYRGLTHQDALAHILALESRDNFVKELQNILGTRLLEKHEANFEKEIRLLELFKLRFEVSNLQASEIMVHDVMESTRTDEAVSVFIRHIPRELEQNCDFEFHAKILSKFYWPSLREDTFLLPPQILAATRKYSEHFQLIKPGRTLDWLPTLGHVVLDLEYGDHNIRQECTTWQAVVIQQFQCDDDSASHLFTLEDLQRELHIDESLLISALTFWVGRMVLELTPEGQYKLLNGRTENVDASAAAAAAAQVAAAPTTLKSSADLLSENAQLYTNFVTSMLTNQGGMTAEKILMMLKLLIAGGVSFELDELRGLLDKLVDDGTLELRGNVYKTARQ